jgi:hypothetical protein
MLLCIKKIILSRLITVVDCLSGDGQDDDRVLLSDLQNFLEQPVFVDFQTVHGILVLLLSHILSRVPDFC